MECEIPCKEITITGTYLKPIARFNDLEKTKLWACCVCYCGLSFETLLKNIECGKCKSCGCYRSWRGY